MSAGHCRNRPIRRNYNYHRNYENVYGFEFIGINREIASTVPSLLFDDISGLGEF